MNEVRVAEELSYVERLQAIRFNSRLSAGVAESFSCTTPDYADKFN
jgi:hypothetical protein